VGSARTKLADQEDRTGGCSWWTRPSG